MRTERWTQLCASAAEDFTSVDVQVDDPLELESHLTLHRIMDVAVSAHLTDTGCDAPGIEATDTAAGLACRYRCTRCGASILVSEVVA